MTQRNPMNERYTTEKVQGKTRKSAASAKPSAARAATVRDPAPKTAKQKKAEARERDRKLAEKRGVSPRQVNSGGGAYDIPTPEYRKWRRIWWISLIVAMVCAVPGFFLMQNGAPQAAIYALLIVSWAGLIFALYVDLGKMRKLRKQYNAQVIAGKSKEARAEQKKRAQELREQRKEAEEAYKKAQEEKEDDQPKRKGIVGLFAKDRK